MTCRVLVADPPWRFRDRLPGRGRGAEKHYPTLGFHDLCRFPLPRIETNAILFLWRVASIQMDALRIIEAWGFAPKTELVWRKTTRSGKRHFGMGRTVRAEHETCLVGTRGRPLILDHSIRSVFDAPTGRHSEKPDEFFEIVEKLCGPAMPATHVELFGRKLRPGWTVIGNEV